MIVVDRFEVNFAVCEDRQTKEIINIEISKLPENVKEGDIIIISNDEYVIDYEERNRIEERIKNKVQNLFEED